MRFCTQRSVRSRRCHGLDALDDAELDKDERLVGIERQIEHLRERLTLEVRQAARAIRLFRLQAISRRRLATAFGVAFDQRYEALVEQPPVLGAQSPSCRRVARQACVQALIEQDAAGIEFRAADQADTAFQGNMRFLIHGDDLQCSGGIARDRHHHGAAQPSGFADGHRPRARGNAARADLDGENAVVR